MPGPGVYEPKDIKYQPITYKFGDLERPDQVARETRTNPGPGYYQQPDLIGKDVPAFTIGER